MSREAKLVINDYGVVIRGGKKINIERRKILIEIRYVTINGKYGYGIHVYTAHCCGAGWMPSVDKCIFDSIAAMCEEIINWVKDHDGVTKKVIEEIRTKMHVVAVFKQLELF